MSTPNFSTPRGEIFSPSEHPDEHTPERPDDIHVGGEEVAQAVAQVLAAPAGPLTFGPGGSTPAVALTDTALTLPDDLTFDQWVTLGEQITSLARSSNWLIGDYLRYAADRQHTDPTWGHYLDRFDIDGFEPSRLADAVFVAETIPPEQRQRDLSWETHRAVASLKDPEARTQQLRLALEEGWTEREAARSVKAAKAIDTTSDDGGADVEERPTPPTVTVMLRGVPAVHVDTVRNFTERLVDVLKGEGVDGLECKVVAK